MSKLKVRWSRRRHTAWPVDYAALSNLAVPPKSGEAEQPVVKEEQP